ncbi:3594_t:CDS:2, partial [Funneliformis geosporum]
PVIIFKLKNIPHEIFPDGVKIRVNEKGWVNKEEMLYIKNRLDEKQINIAVIPEGLTGRLQLLD